MSWNLLIHSSTNDGESRPLGTLTSVRTEISAAFPEIEWQSDIECGLYVTGGFVIEWNVDGELVKDGFTNGGYNHLKQLAHLCKRMGWSLADTQEGENIDLDDPYSSFEDREEE